MVWEGGGEVGEVGEDAHERNRTVRETKGYEEGWSGVSGAGTRRAGGDVRATNSIHTNALRPCTSTHQLRMSAYSSGIDAQFMGTWRQRAVENALKAKVERSDGTMRRERWKGVPSQKMLRT